MRKLRRQLRRLKNQKPVIEDLEDKVLEILRQTPEGPQLVSSERVLLWFDSICASYKGKVEGLLPEVEAARERAREQAKKIAEEIKDIPETERSCSVALPAGITDKLFFFLRLVAALFVITAEVASLAVYLRFVFDSIAWALTLCAVPFFVAVTEPVYLYSPHVSKRARKIVFLIQGPLALVAAGIYFFYTIHFGERSGLAARFSGTHHGGGLSLLQMRQLWQGVASVLMSGVLFSAASALLERTESEPVPNRKLEKARKEAERHHAKAAELDGILGGLKGELETLEKDRERCRLLAEAKGNAATNLKSEFHRRLGETFQNLNRNNAP
jgi:hypothetical protein